TTVAALLEKMSDPRRYPSARVLLIDMHGEYAAALKDRAAVFRTNPSVDEHPLHIPFWALTSDELLPITLGALEDRARTAVLDRIADMKAESLLQQPRSGITDESLTVDSPVPFSLHELWLELHK